MGPGINIVPSESKHLGRDRLQSLSGGVVSVLRRIRSDLYVQIDAATSKGSSGGGLFDHDARLVGIKTFYAEDGQKPQFRNSSRAGHGGGAPADRI